MRCLVCAILLVLSLCSLAADPPVLTGEILVASGWNSNPDTAGSTSLAFAQDGTYVASYYGEGGSMSNAGKWEMSDGTLLLTPSPVRAPQRPVHTEPWRYRYGEAADTLVYMRYLETVPGTAAGITFWNTSVQVRRGESRTVDGVPVVVVRENGTVADGVNLREKPGTAAARVKVTLNVYRAPYGDYLPGGFELQVVARTAAKATVGDWESYWYYCDLAGVGGHLGLRTIVEGTQRSTDGHAWIYGRFVTLQ